jgi:hypothetical protein
VVDDEDLEMDRSTLDEDDEWFDHDHEEWFERLLQCCLTETST